MTEFLQLGMHGTLPEENEVKKSYIDLCRVHIRINTSWIAWSTDQHSNNCIFNTHRKHTRAPTPIQTDDHAHTHTPCAHTHTHTHLSRSFACVVCRQVFQDYNTWLVIIHSSEVSGW